MQFIKMTELTDILSHLVTNSEKQEERFAEQQSQIAEQQSHIAELLKSIKEPPPVTVEYRQPGPLQHSFIAQRRAIVLTLLLGKPLSNNSSLPETVFLDSCHLS